MSYHHFSKHERNELSVLLKRGYSYSDIAQALGKSHSSVSREVKKNSVKGVYDPAKAHQKARTRRKGSKYQNMKINESPVFLKFLEEKLQVGWTPEQIAGRWNRDHAKPQFSFKSIYKYLYSIYGQRLCRYLLSKQYSRRKRTGRGRNRFRIKNRVSIERRPKVVNERRRFGDFEGDVLGSSRTNQERLPALVERVSRKLFAVKVPRLKYAVDGFKNMLKPYRDILKSVTFDNGPENARHLELGCPTYFCHPYSAWEKGQIENTLGRLRRFVKKKSSLSLYSDQDISAFVERMNETPRKCLGFRTPNEIFKELLFKSRKKRCQRSVHFRG
jgi:IS30 family transposase